MTTDTAISYDLYSWVPQYTEPIHKLLVREDNTIDGHDFETHYRVAEKLIDYGDFIGVVCCDGADAFIETRIPKAVIKEVLEKSPL